MTFSTKQEAEDLAAVIAEGIRTAISSLVARIAALEKDARNALRDAGIWSEQKTYMPGDTVTHDGSSWVAQLVSKAERPGASNAWRLFTKRGRDGAMRGRDE